MTANIDFKRGTDTLRCRTVTCKDKTSGRQLVAAKTAMMSRAGEIRWRQGDWDRGGVIRL